MGAPLWQQMNAMQASQYPSQMGASNMQFMNSASNHHFMHQPQNQAFAGDLQSQFAAPQQQSFAPMSAFTVTSGHSQQQSAFMVPPAGYDVGVSLPHKPVPVSTNPAAATNAWNPSMAMPDQHQVGPSYYPMPQDTPQTQQAIALQKAALQQQMQLAYNEAQQFEQQLAVKQQLRAHSIPAQQQPSLAGWHGMHQNATQSLPRSGLMPKQVKKRKALTFPEKFMAALVKHEANEDVVAWLPDGKSFVIVNPELFVKQVLAPVFKHSKYASFVRKLHRWGFQRLTSGSGTDCFHHPMFCKHRQELVKSISCMPRDGMNGKMDHESLELSPHGLPDLLSVSPPPSLAGVEKFAKIRPVSIQLAPVARMGLPPVSDLSEEAAGSCGTSTVTTTSAIPAAAAMLEPAGEVNVNVHSLNESLASAPTRPKSGGGSEDDDSSTGSGNSDPSHTGMLKRTLLHASLASPAERVDLRIP